MKPDSLPSEKPPSTRPQKSSAAHLLSKLKLFKPRQEATLREAIEGYIEDKQEETGPDPVSSQEKALISNILKLQSITVQDVMIPRADILAISEDIPQDELLDLLSERQVSRLPVYRETLDDIQGTIHIKDVVSTLAAGRELNIQEMLKNVPIVSPSMSVIDLILEMRLKSRHMALVVDEFGGIDGLITVGDVIEEIVGEIDDEHNRDDEPKMIDAGNGTIIADARVYLEDFEEQHGRIFTEEELEECDTIGGLLCHIAGHVPARGEIIKHDTGMVFEVQDADPRRVNLVKIRNIPEPASLTSEE